MRKYSTRFNIKFYNRSLPDGCFRCELAVEQHELCCTHTTLVRRRPSDDDKAQLARKYQLVAVARALLLYQSVSCPTAWCFGFEAVYGGCDDDDDDKLVSCS